MLDGKSDEKKLHSMLNEEFWGVAVNEESGLVHGPFKHAFNSIAKYVAAAWRIRNVHAHPCGSQKSKCRLDSLAGAPGGHLSYHEDCEGSFPLAEQHCLGL